MSTSPLLSVPLAALFPAGVAAAELSTDRFLPLHSEDPDAEALAQAHGLLTEAEWQGVVHCRAARVRDFTAGRLCARCALDALGIEPSSLLSAPDRRPLWPAGISGSITHTIGYAAAVVGPLNAVGSLGLDTERIGDVEERLWPEVCTAAELLQLDGWPQSARAEAAALCFVAKEAFYKAQFPVCAEALDFDAVWIQLPHAPLAQGIFQVHPLRPLRIAPAMQVRSGRFRRHGEYVSAGIALSLV